MALQIPSNFYAGYVREMWSLPGCINCVRAFAQTAFGHIDLPNEFVGDARTILTIWQSDESLARQIETVGSKSMKGS